MEDQVKEGEIAIEDYETPSDLGDKIKQLFGVEIFEAFQREEVVNEIGISDLLEREADAKIFQRLSLTYGKALLFQKEFAFLKRKTKSFGAKTTPSPPPKPTMAELEMINPEVKQLYLTKRKKIGVLAASKWKDSAPKFNTPKAKAELDQFAEEIEPEIGIKELNFGKEGIKKHIKSFFNEQRRYKKRKYDHDEIPGSQAIKKEKQSSLSSSDLEESSVEVDQDESGDTEILSEADDEWDASQQPASPTTPSHKPTCSAVDHASSSTNVSDTENPVDTLTLKLRRGVIKAVFGKHMEREGCVDVLKKKFFLKNNSLTNLTPSEVISVLIRKLLKERYIEFTTPVTSMKDVKVLKEIAMM